LIAIHSADDLMHPSASLDELPDSNDVRALALLFDVVSRLFRVASLNNKDTIFGAVLHVICFRAFARFPVTRITIPAGGEFNGVCKEFPNAAKSAGIRKANITLVMVAFSFRAEFFADVDILYFPVVKV